MTGKAVVYWRYVRNYTCLYFHFYVSLNLTWFCLYFSFNHTQIHQKQGDIYHPCVIISLKQQRKQVHNRQERDRHTFPFFEFLCRELGGREAYKQKRYFINTSIIMISLHAQSQYEVQTYFFNFRTVGVQGCGQWISNKNMLSKSSKKPYLKSWACNIWESSWYVGLFAVAWCWKSTFSRWDVCQCVNFTCTHISLCRANERKPSHWRDVSLVTWIIIFSTVVIEFLPNNTKTFLKIHKSCNFIEMSGIKQTSHVEINVLSYEKS